MKLSFSTNAYTRFTVFEAIKKIADIGFDGVEILADVPHVFADAVEYHDLYKLKQLVDETDLKVANINANTAVGFYQRDFWEPLFEPSLAHPDKTLRQWRINYTKKCVDLAQFFGSPCVSITSGRTMSGLLPNESLGILKRSLIELVDYAEEQGIRLGIEYEPGLIIECCEELENLLSEIDSPFLGANLDLGHSYVLGEDATEVIMRLGKRIFHVHIEDICARKHYHLIPGTGDMDFSVIFGALRSVGYDGFVSTELYTYSHMPDEAAKQSLMYLRRLL